MDSKRFKRMLKESARGRLNYWDKQHLEFVANASINIAKTVTQIAKQDKAAAIFAVGRKGLIAERIIRATCNEMGVRLEKPFCMKAKPSTASSTEVFQFGGAAYAGLQGKAREEAFEIGAKTLAEYIKSNPTIYSQLKTRRNIIVIEEFSAQRSQAYYFKRALEIVAPNATVHLFILLEGLKERQFPDAIRPEFGMSDRNNKTRKIPFGKEHITEEAFLISDLLKDPETRAYIADVRRTAKQILGKS